MHFIPSSKKSTLVLSLKRLWVQRWLSLSLMAGLLAVTALTTAIPRYADAIHFDILESTLSSSAAPARRQPFDFVFRYIGSWYGAITPQQYQLLDQYLSERAAGEIGLPLQGLTRYAATANLQLYPADASLAPQSRLDLVKAAFLSDVFEHVQVIDGQLPQAVAVGQPREALVSLDLANELGLAVGGVYTLFIPASGSTAAFRQDVRISGLWVPSDKDEAIWSLYPADSFRKKLLFHEEDFWDVAGALPAGVDEATWRLSLDGSRVTSSQVDSLLAGIDRVQNRVERLLPKTSLETSPAAAMRQYRQAVRSLAGALFAFSVPVLGLVLFFLAMIAGMFVRGQHGEIAVLRSRGAARGWVLAVYATQWLILSLASLLPGIFLGGWLARLMSKTASFLDFSRPAANVAWFSARDISLGLLAMAVAALFCLLPVWRYGRDTIISYKQELARGSGAPFWQRYYLDLACFLPAAYGWYTLQARGRLAILGRNIGSSDPYENPLLFLLPALMILGLSLLVLRVLPFIFNLLATLAERLRGIALLYALRHFARSRSAYSSVLLLIMLTFGLAMFSASMASSLDRTLSDSLRYTNGADLNLIEGGEFIPTIEERDSQVGTGGQSAAAGYWNFLPLSDHLTLPGVNAAARVGRYSAALQAGGRQGSGELIGIDRGDFARVAFWRQDFASEPLNGLLNRLSASPDAILVDRGTWERFNLETGSRLELRVTINRVAYPLTFSVAGVFERFPGWDSRQQPAAFVANLDYLFETWGMLQPYEIWLDTEPGGSTEALVNGINRMGVSVVRVRDTEAGIASALYTPARQGVLGMLSIGFLAALALTVLGFFLFSIFSYRERFIQLGVLRAIGLSIGQMRASLGLELVLLVLIGSTAGMAAGVVVARSFIPLLPVTGGTGVEVLPQITQIAWSKMGLISLVFGLALAAGLAVLVSFLRRIKIFQAIKLGDTL